MESVVTKTRDRNAALKFLKKSMKRHGRPETIVTDRLRLYGAALKDLGRGDDREVGRWLGPCLGRIHVPTERHPQYREIDKQTRSAAFASWRRLCS